MKNYLYTFILDYRGGTYISQVEAPDHLQAALVWAQGLDTEPIAGMGARRKKCLVRDIESQVEEHGIVGLDTLTNAWCTSLLLRGKFGLLNIIRTCRD